MAWEYASLKNKTKMSGSSFEDYVEVLHFFSAASLNLWFSNVSSMSISSSLIVNWSHSERLLFISVCLWFQHFSYVPCINFMKPCIGVVPIMVILYPEPETLDNDYQLRDCLQFSMAGVLGVRQGAVGTPWHLPGGGIQQVADSLAFRFLLYFEEAIARVQENCKNKGT